MKSPHLIATLLVLFIFILSLASCSETEPTPVPPTATDAGPSPTATPSAPVARSDIESTFREPLSSGLSIADVTENALPSVARIVTGTGSGTGFIVNEGGLVVTNKHVVEGSTRVSVRMAEGSEYQGSVTKRHPTLDLAYVSIDSSRTFTPIAIGDSDEVRVGAEIIVIGFPLASSLGAEPTVSVGIVSAKRDNRLQTDASVNPGNSGGPLLDMFGQVVGVVVSRVVEANGRPISGIGFAIPINEVKSELGGQVTPGTALPTPTPTPFPTIGPPPDIEATKAAIETIDAFRRASDQATRTAVEAQATAEAYAQSLEATRVAGITPTPTPTATPTATPEPTPTATPTPIPTPTPTPHPRTYCQEWEALVLEWIKQGNVYIYNSYYDYANTYRDAPDHPQLSAEQGNQLCLTAFPRGILGWIKEGPYLRPYMWTMEVGHEANQLLPGKYEYRREGDNRVEGRGCSVTTNQGTESAHTTDMVYGEPFTIQLYSYHSPVTFDFGLPECEGSLYRIGD